MMSQKARRWTLFIGTLILIAQSCFAQNYSKRKIQRDLRDLPGFRQAYVGFQLYDPIRDKVIASHLEDKFMTPASNTKLFTFYAGLQLLDDAVPSMQYIITGDSLIFWATGNPLLLHPETPDNTVLEFLKERTEKLFYWKRPTQEKRYGPGWSWDDYGGYYSAEKSIFPIHGNSTLNLIDRNTKEIKVIPNRLANDYKLNPDTSLTRNTIRRKEFTNDYEYRIGQLDPSAEEEVDVDSLVRPFLYSDELFRKLLSDTLRRSIRPYSKTPVLPNAETLYGWPIDTLYKHMLQPSDNLFAEQILMMASGQLSDTLSTRQTIDHMQENYFSDWQDELVWVDGSGLSRYNMFTPRTVVTLLKKLREEVGESRLFELLPAGGISGTIENWYAGENEPYVFAKTGTLSNNHCLSGFIKTKKGKTLIFSFMVNHYSHSTNEVRQSMEIMLQKIRNGY